MPVPPLDKNWKPPENPNNPPLPRDWKPPENPNNPPLSPDWKPAPGKGLMMQPPNGYTPASGGRSRPSSGGAGIPAGAVAPNGYFYGTTTKAWSPENDPLGLSSSRNQQDPNYFKPQIDPQTGRMGASQAFRDQQANLPWMKNRQPQAPSGPRPDEFFMGTQGGGMQLPPEAQNSGMYARPMQQPMGPGFDVGGRRGRGMQLPPEAQDSGMYAQPPGRQQMPFNPLMPTSPTNMPPQMTEQDISDYQYQMQGGRFGSADRAAGMHQGYTENAYTEAYNQLEKARQSVMVDPRFSPEQRQQALERIASRADELDQGFLAAKPFESSPIGYDAPPPEQFAELQEGTGLQSMQDGRFRNPETGDIMRSVRAQNGQLVPLPQTQSEIDALPPGTRYMDQAGKLQMTPGAGGGQGRSASAGTGTQRQGGAGAPMSAEDAYAAYEKWAAKQDPASTPSERQVIANAVASVPDPELRDTLTAMMKSDPEATLAALQEQGIDLGNELEQARIQEFATQQKSKGERTKRVAEALGIEIPQETKPAIDPKRYRREVGTRGTMQLRRRGSDIAIPMIDGPSGEAIPAPQQMRQLADLEVDTEFANIIPQEDGNELRVLPFSQQTVNLGNFSLTDAQRRLFAKETSNIQPRPPEEWAKFEDLIQKFQTTDEAWDPENKAAQSQLEEIVGNFYSELQPAGRALMTMYIAHSLGYKIDKGRGFDSTGWAKNPDKANKNLGQTGVNLPTNFIADELAQKLYKIGFADVDGDELAAGGGRTKEYEQGLNDMAKNIWTIAHEMERRAQNDSPQNRAYFGSKYQQIDRMVDSVARQNGFGDSAKGRAIVQDLRKRLSSWTEQTAPKATPKPSAPAPTPAPRRETPTPAAPPTAPQAQKPVPAQTQQVPTPTPQPVAEQGPWSPEKPSFFDMAFGAAIGSKDIQAKGRLRAEYDRLQEQMQETADLRKRYPNDPSVANDANRAKKEFEAFVQSKGKDFKPFGNR